MILSILVSIVMIFTNSAYAKEGFHICYFSLNNEKEFQEMEKFTEKLNRFSEFKITVSEHLTEENKNPEEAFEKMVQTTHCDGLVISGHHTGAFGGRRANGSLRIDFLEKLSCNKEYEKWFHSIHSVWLQGCRTLGVGKIATTADEIPDYDPDYHTQRVGQALEEDNLEQGLADLNMEFSATLDQDNPLSSRYLRTFSRAKVFGWTKTAPGKNAQSEYSIPFHIAHISKLLDKEEANDIKAMENPLNNQFDKSQVQSYLNALDLLLDDLSKSESHCEDLVVKGWLDHGRANGKVEPYSFDNPDLQALPKLLYSENNFQKELKEKECALKTAKNKEEKLKAIDALIANQTYIQFGFNSIWEALQQSNDEDLQNAIREKLKNNPNVIEFIKRKIESKQLGILRKIDYYGFYRDLFKTENKIFESKLSQSIINMLSENVSDNNYAALDYRQTLIYSAVKNKIFSPVALNKLIDLKGIRKSELSSIADALVDVANSDNNIYGFEQYDRIIKAKNSDYEALASLAYAIGKSKNEIKNADILLREILQSDKSEITVLQYIVNAIKSSKFPIKNSEQLLKDIASSPIVVEEVLTDIVDTLDTSSMPLAKQTPIIEALTVNETSNSEVFRKLAFHIAKSEKPFPNAEKYYEKMIIYAQNSAPGTVDKLETAGGVAVALLEQKKPVKNTDKLLKKIVEGDLLGFNEKEDLAFTILHSEENFIKWSSLFEKILKSSEFESLRYYSLVAEALSDKTPAKIKTTALKKIISQPLFGNYDYTDTANQMIKAPSFPGGDSLLKEIIDNKISDPYYLQNIFKTLIENEVQIKDVQTFQKIIIESPKMKASNLIELKKLISEKNLNETDKKHLLELVQKNLDSKQK